MTREACSDTKYFFACMGIEPVTSNTRVHTALTMYCNAPKFSGARKLRCKLPKIQTKRPNLRVFIQKDANGIANSEDPDQTAPLGAV